MEKYTIAYWDAECAHWYRYGGTDDIIEANKLFNEAKNTAPMAELLVGHAPVRVLAGFYGDEDNLITVRDLVTGEVHQFPSKGSEYINLLYIRRCILEPQDLYAYYDDNCPESWNLHRSIVLHGENKNWSRRGILSLNAIGEFTLWYVDIKPHLAE